MVAFKAHEATRALSKPDPRWRVWLIYGPDTGLVSERVSQIVKTALGAEGDDPFRLIQLDGDAVAGDPLRLLDEANTIGLFGGERVIRISRTAKMLGPAVEAVLKAPPDSAIIIIEAGEMTPKNPLRVACERSAHAVALPCYADDGRNLAELVDSTMREAGLTMERGARDLLLASLGSDRMVSRQEINKLLLYVGQARSITLADVEACVGDSAVREMDTLIDAAFTGQGHAADQAYRRLRAEGMDATVLAGAALRQALLLLEARLKIEGGQPRQLVGDALRLPYPRKVAAHTMLNHWNSVMLAATTRSLGTTMAEARKNTALSTDIVQRAFLDIGRKANQRR
jgi:DNA polymerase III subunit delta